MHARIWAITIAGVAGAAAAGLWAARIARRGRKKSPEEVERLRRQSVNATGRIVTGKILELVEPDADHTVGLVLLYEYEVAGVTYDAAQDVSALPEVAAAAPFLPGQTTSVKCDPKHPSNSIIACEGWCGIPDLHAPANPAPAPAEKASNDNRPNPLGAASNGPS